MAAGHLSLARQQPWEDLAKHLQQLLVLMLGPPLLQPLLLQAQPWQQYLQHQALPSPQE
jgi:hypothetical protein